MKNGAICSKKVQKKQKKREIVLLFLDLPPFKNGSNFKEILRGLFFQKKGVSSCFNFEEK